MTVQLQTEDYGGSAGATPTERYLALDSLRGVCAVCVALFHFQSIGAIHATPLVLHSFMFVDFFFVLSGFVISASYGRKLTSGFPIGRFMLLRLGRLYPLHLFMLLIFLAVAVIGPRVAPSLAVRAPFQGETSLAEFLYGLFFVQVFFGTSETWWNPPTWSIAAEIWVYLIAAVLFRLAKAKLMPITAVVVMVALAVYVYGFRYDANAHHWGAVPRCLFSFGQGMLSFQLFGWLRPRLAKMDLVAWTLAESAVLLAAILLVIGDYTLIGPLAFAASVIVFAFQGGWWSRVLQTAPMLLLGTLSYSIYMVHFFIQARYLNAVMVLGKLAGSPNLVAQLHGDVPGGSRLVADSATIGMVPVVIAVAWCTYHLIERPGQRWSRRVVLGGGRGKAARRAEASAPTF